uniref:Fructosamine kinase n=2 Tax=Histophilus somni TaxID=731 RepID=Q0I3M3_HISS1
MRVKQFHYLIRYLLKLDIYHRILPVFRLSSSQANLNHIGGAMWKSISQVLAEQFGAYYFIKHKEKLYSGEMNEIWLINDEVQTVFVKINERSYRSMFRAEADQLALLAKTNSINVPLVYGIGNSQGHSFLLLEALNKSKNKQSSFTIFAEKIAQLHQIQGPDKYGLDFDTWLGPIYQPNDWQTSWAKFFSENRIGWQLQICKEKGLIFGNIDLIVQIVADTLSKHNPKPSILHGNLWIENCIQVDDKIFVCNPACYWGDRECDIAFSSLFEPFPTNFYQRYNEIYPLEEGYLERKLIYQLYYLLNFSYRYYNKKQSYVSLTQKLINQILHKIDK